MMFTRSYLLYLLLFIVQGINSELLAEARYEIKRIDNIYERQELVWVNVQSYPEWRGGPKPRLNVLKQEYEVYLEAGESNLIALPAMESLKFEIDQSMLSELSIWKSDDLGIEEKIDVKKDLILESVKTENERIGFVNNKIEKGVYRLQSTSNRSQMIRFIWPKVKGRSISFPIYISKTRGVLRQSLLRDVEINSEQVKVHEKGDSELRTFYRLNPDEETFIDLIGNQDYEIEYLYLYQAHQKQKSTDFRVMFFSGENEKKEAVLEYNCSVRKKSPLMIDNKILLSSHVKRASVKTSGEKGVLRMHVSAPVLFRVLGPKNTEFAWQANKEKEFNTQLSSTISRWDIELQNFNNDISALSFPNHYMTLVDRIAKDNRWKDGGLIAHHLLLQKAKSTNNLSTRQKAWSIYSRHSTFVEKIPYELKPGDSIPRYSYIPMKLGIESKDYWFFAPFLEEGLKAIPMAFFYKLNEYQTLEYRFKKKNYPRKIRVTALNESFLGGESLLVLVNGKLYKELGLRKRSLQEMAMLESTSKEAMGLYLERQGLRADLERPGEKRREPAIYAETSSIELELPVGASQVEIKTKDQVRVSLAERRSKTHRMSATNYKQMKKVYERGGETIDLFHSQLSEKPIDEPHAAVRYAALDLVNHWSALTRFIRNRAHNFASFQNQMDLEDKDQKVDSKQMESWRKQAISFEKNGDWLSAIENLKNLIAVSSESQKGVYILKQIQLLEKAGEERLAFHLARHHLVKLKKNEVVQNLYRWLDKYYQKQNDYDGKLTLACYELQHHFSVEKLEHLAKMFVANGYEKYGLDLYLLSDYKNIDQQLSLSLSQGNEQNFIDKYKDLLDHQKEEWRVRYYLQKGEFERAKKWMKDNDPLVSRFKEGNEIRKALSSKQKDPSSLLKRWAKWQSEAGQLRGWKNYNHTVDQHTGGLTVYNPVLNVHKQYFLNRGKDSISFRVLGPKRVRVEVRILHPKKIEMLRGKYTINQGEQELASVIVHSKLSKSSLELVGEEEFSLGQRIVREINVGPGDRMLKLRGEGLPFLVSLSALLPQVSSEILPTLNHRVANSHFDKSFKFNVSSTLFQDEKQIAEVSEDVHDGIFDRRLWAVQIENKIEIPKATSGRRLSPTPKSFELKLDRILKDEDRPRRERLERDRRGEMKASLSLKPLKLFEKAMENFRNEAVEVANPEAKKSSQEAWLKKARKFLESEVFNEEKLKSRSQSWELIDYLEMFEKQIELRPKLGGEVLKLCIDLKQQTKLQDKEKKILISILRHADWKLVESLESSAGFKTVELEGWQPETEKSRLWKSLLSFDKRSFVLGSQKNLLIPFRNKKKGQFKIELHLIGPSFLPTAPMDITFRLNKDKEIIKLDANRKNWKKTIRVGPGEHSLYFESSKAGLGQYVEILILENEKETFVGDILKNSTKRSYHVALPGDAVFYKPAVAQLVRVSEAVDPSFPKVRYHHLKAGEELVLEAVDNKETLFRIHELEFKYRPPDFIADSGQFEKIQIGPVPALSYKIKAPSNPDYLKSHKKLTQLGSLSLLTRYGKRDGYLGDEEEETRDSEEFLRGGLTFRYKSARFNHYYKTDVFFREYTKALPIFYSMRQKIDMKDLPFGSELGLSYKLNTQKFSSQHLANIQAVPGREFAGHLNVSLSKRIPISERLSYQAKVSVNQRWLSLNRAESQFLKRVDPDIYSTYKDIHSRYLSIREQISYKYSKDVRVFLSGGLNTNEDYNPLLPDVMFLGLSTAQQIGAFELRYGYLLRAYRNDPQRSEHSLVNRFNFRIDRDHLFRNRILLRTGLNVQLAPEDDKYTVLFDLQWFPFFRGDYLNHVEGDPFFIRLKRRRLAQE